MVNKTIAMLALLFGVAGVLAVAVLLLVGRDPQRASRTGPRWKRRLLTVGLSLLGAMGISLGPSFSCVCYVPVPWASMDRDDFQQAISRLRRQTTLLEQQAQTRTLDAETLWVTVRSVRADRQALGSSQARDKLDPAGREQAEKLCARADAALIRMVDLLESPFLDRPVASAAPPRPEPTTRPVAPQVSAAQRKAAQEQWQGLEALWQHCGRLASGGSYDEDNRRSMREVLLPEADAMERMHRAGVLSEAEARAMRMEILVLADALYLPPAPGPYGPPATVDEWKIQDSLRELSNLAPAYGAAERVRRRMPALRGLAATSHVRLDVFERLASTVGADLACLLRDPDSSRFGPNRTPAERAAERALAEQAWELLSVILARVPLGTDKLQADARWKTIHVAWHMARSLAGVPSTTAQRKATQWWLRVAANSARGLARAKLLTEAEAGLLGAEAERLRGEMCKRPPLDSAVTCYVPINLPEALSSLERLARRVPLLQRLAASGKVRNAVLARVLPVVRQDLKVLADEKKVAELRTEADRAKARKTCAAAQEALGRIDKLLEKHP